MYVEEESESSNGNEEWMVQLKLYFTNKVLPKAENKVHSTLEKILYHEGFSVRVPN